MSWSIYSDGNLVERGDDATLTVTDYNPDGTVASTRPYTANEKSLAEANLRDQSEMGHLADRIAALEQIVIANLAVASTPPALSDLAAKQGGALYPGQQITWTDAQVYIQNATVPLNSNATPASYPQGWKLATAPTAAAWAAGVAYAVGALASYNGVTYKCIQAHTSQVGWEPPNVPALWAPA